MPTSPPPTYTDLEIRILDREARGYPVNLTGSGSQFPRGYLNAGALPDWVHG